MGICSSGRTTLSASGMLLPHTLYDSAVAEQLCDHGDRFPVLVVTVASIVEPFLSVQHRQNNISQVEIIQLCCSCLVACEERGIGI